MTFFKTQRTKHMQDTNNNPDILMVGDAVAFLPNTETNPSSEPISGVVAEINVSGKSSMIGGRPFSSWIPVHSVDRQRGASEDRFAIMVRVLLTNPDRGKNALGQTVTISHKHGWMHDFADKNSKFYPDFYDVMADDLSRDPIEEAQR